MGGDAILERLKQVMGRVKPEVDLTGAGRDTVLREDLGMDSLSLLLMALQSEEEFGIRFENMEAVSFRTVGDVCRYIEEKL